MMPGVAGIITDSLLVFYLYLLIAYQQEKTMTNYAKLGEYTAYKKQAQDAATCRYALLNNLANELMRLKDEPESAITETTLSAKMLDIVKADKEMRAALDVANQAAALCGESELTLRRLLAVYR
jgi:hypothetical protein